LTLALSLLVISLYTSSGSNQWRSQPKIFWGK